MLEAGPEAVLGERCVGYHEELRTGAGEQGAALSVLEPACAGLPRHSDDRRCGRADRSDQDCDGREHGGVAYAAYGIRPRAAIAQHATWRNAVGSDYTAALATFVMP